MSSNIIEKTYVQDTYKKIAKQFSITRGYLWKSVKQFLDNINPYSIIVEIGSGNGRNLSYRKDCINMAFDFCKTFCEITHEKNLDSVIANNLHIPLQTNSIDYVLSVAVIHHLSTNERRQKALHELIRILRPGGKLLIQVWAMEQPTKSRRKFHKQDNYVTFKNPDKTMCEKRFYHVFTKGELDSIVKLISNVIILKSYWEFGNWVAIVQKS